MTDPTPIHGAPPDDSAEDLVAAVVDDFRARRARGEEPDPEEYAARHPHAADLLRRVLAAFRLVGPPTPAATRDGPAAAGGVLGDFRIVRELGRGGMGVVYEAEQLGLRRRVALKVLPFAAVIDPRRLRRFHNEALAAAGLDHPHVVKVYAVGSERGVHFIAMQLVDGRTLADLIRERRGERPAALPPRGPADPTRTRTPDPTPGGPNGAPRAGSGGRTPVDVAYARRAAGWGAQAADALEHAHSLGVVHRDVKPGNLLVDGRGELHVADFGLARLGADAGVTGTGDLLGTPRYMSPEQAAARHNLVDHRSDVYSLGATLYEVLTLEPAVGGDDRAEILRRIGETDPTPPRKLDRLIPRDLETVLLKCLEKDPARRYASAKDLADDLRRFLAHEPVRAKRVTLRERAARWAARRPRTVAAAAVFAAALLGAFVVWDRDRARADGMAREAVDQADDLRRRGRLPEAEAVARRAVALLPRFGGDRDLRRRANELVTDVTLLRRLDGARLKRINTQPDTTDIDPGPSLAALAAAFREEYGVDVLSGDEAAVLAVLRARAIRTDLVAALDDWGCATRKPAESRRLFGLADALDPDRQRVAGWWRRVDPGALDELRELAAEAERDPPPTTFLVRLGLGLIASGQRPAGFGLLELAHRRRPDDVWALITLAQELLKAGPEYRAEALRYWTAAHSLRPGNPNVLANLGYTLNQLGRHEEAVEYLRTAAAVEPDSAIIRGNLGVSYAGLGRHEDAVREFRQSVAIDPTRPHAWGNLGISLRHLNRCEEAIEPLRKAAALRPDPQALRGLSTCLTALGRPAEAEEAARAAVKLDPNNAEGHFRLGITLLNQNRAAEAAEAFRWSLLLRPEAGTCYNLALALARQGGTRTRNRCSGTRSGCGRTTRRPTTRSATR